MNVRGTSEGQLFRTTELLDFSVEDEREISIYQTDSDGEPTLYLIKKFVNANIQELKSITKDFGSTPQQFTKSTID